MKKLSLLTFIMFASIGLLSAQKVAYEAYDLDNGMHVILHQDNGAPVVTTSVMYHVGGKDEETDKTGFAHFLNTFYLKVQKILNVEIGLK